MWTQKSDFTLCSTLSVANISCTISSLMLYLLVKTLSMRVAIVLFRGLVWISLVIKSLNTWLQENVQSDITRHVRYLSKNIIQIFGKLNNIGIWRTIYKPNHKRHGVITYFYKQWFNVIIHHTKVNHFRVYSFFFWHKQGNSTTSACISSSKYMIIASNAIAWNIKWIQQYFWQSNDRKQWSNLSIYAKNDDKLIGTLHIFKCKTEYELPEISYCGMYLLEELSA